MAKVYKGAGTQIAKLPGVQSMLDVAAEKIKVNAEINAAAHHRTGAHESSYRVRSVPGKSGVRDRIVENTDPAALEIEYGHAAPTNRGVARWVPGQFNLTRAVK